MTEQNNPPSLIPSHSPSQIKVIPDLPPASGGSEGGAACGGSEGGAACGGSEGGAACGGSEGGAVATYRWKTPPELWQKLKPFARQMRREPTLAEARLWEKLRNKQLLGFKFRRQHAIDRFIVDFYCGEAQLVVEVDGEIHDYTQEQDAIRQEFLESLGLRVVRFRNEEVLNLIDGVLEEIAQTLQPTP